MFIHFNRNLISYKLTPLSDQFLQVDFVLWPTLPAWYLLLFPSISLTISKGKRNLIEKVTKSVWPEKMWYSELLICRYGIKRRAFKIFIFDGAKKTGAPKKWPKEQLSEAQKRWKSCRYWPSFWDPQEGSIIMRSHTVEEKKKPNSESHDRS